MGSAHTTRYTGIEQNDELGGGLNNLLMNLAQLLHDSCKSDAVLVLPHITSGWRFFRGTTHTHRPFEFGEIFNASHFIERVRPCRAVEDGALPRNWTASFRKANVVGINAKWPFDHALPRVYTALRPSAQLQVVVDQLATAATEGSGKRWAGVHLRIEKDWWEVSPFCNRARYPTQRCFEPSVIAELTRTHRQRHRSTGTVLFYASDNLSPRGPRVDLSQFGAHTTKVEMPLRLPYTMRAAAEFFLAARAPAGFYGNSFSTFTRGVALLRRTRSKALGSPSPGQWEEAAGTGLALRSFAYDCGSARRETPSSAGGLQYLDTLNR